MNKEALMNAAKASGITALQIDEISSKSTSFRLFEGNVDSFTISDCTNRKIKGLYKGHMGSIVIEQDDDDLIPSIIDALISNAQSITSQDEVELYAGDETYPELVSTKNACLEQTTTQKIELLKAMEQKLLNSDPRVTQVMEITYRDLESGVALDNTEGLHVSRHDDATILSAGILVKDGDDQRSAYDVALLKSLDTFDMNAFVEKLKNDAIAKLHAKQIISGTYPVLMEKKVMADLLSHMMVQFQGEQVAKGISLLKDCLHEQIFDKKVNIVDDPLMNDGIQSAPFDDEGVACHYKKLVEQGTLKGFLHNLKSAKLLHTKSSGNGFGGGISYTNLYLENGDTAYEDMIKTMDHGIIITNVTGLHAGWNMVTTQFSLQASGFYVENGTIRYPLNLITIAGNFLELMKDITLIGNDLEHFYTGVGSPSVLFPAIAISGE